MARDDEYTRAALLVVRQHGPAEAGRILQARVNAALDEGTDDEVDEAQFTLDAFREMQAEEAHEREQFGDGSPT